MYAVIRIRGTANIKKGIEDTLHMLRLNKPNHCIIIPETDANQGMLKKAKDYITWGEIDDKTLEELVTKRAKISHTKKIDQKNAKSIIEKIKKEKLKESDIKPVFQLSPPKKGFERKGIKKTFRQGGALGYRKDKINILLKKML
ncbi:MAG: 50S ribosomal protein L30 [archaeon]|nr:50S ribosomal protein L30 [archaeon]